MTVYTISRAHGATAARRIPDPKVGGSNPSGLIILFFHFFVTKFSVFEFRVADINGKKIREVVAEQKKIPRRVKDIPRPGIEPGSHG